MRTLPGAGQIELMRVLGRQKLDARPSRGRSLAASESHGGDERRTGGRRQAFESIRSPHPAANTDGPPPVCQNTTGPSRRPARASATKPAMPLAL